MIRSRWDGKTIVRYALFQIPGILLAVLVLWTLCVYFGLPKLWALFFLALWLLKDGVLFFFVWPAYQGSKGDGWYSLIGMRGETRNALRPEGYIRIGGVLWKAKAETEQTIKPGAQVVVVGREGIKLIVRVQD